MDGRPAGFSDNDSDEDEFDERFPAAPLSSSSSMPGYIRSRALHNLVPQKAVVKKTQVDLEDFRIASMKGNITLIRNYVDSGTLVDQILRSGWTALMYASSSGQWEVVEYLLEQGANPNFHKELFTPLMAACASSIDEEVNLAKCVNLLLQKGAKVNASERHKVTALMFACKERRLQVVQMLLLSDGVDLNLQDNRGWTALMWAADKGDGPIIRALLEHGEGADKSLLSTSGQKAVDIALIAGHRDVAALLDLSLKPETKPTQPGAPKSATSNGHAEPPVLDSPIVTATVTELETVLMGLDLTNIIPVFHEHKMTYDAFLLLDDGDLDRMGIIEVGYRTKLLNAVKEIHTKEWERGSLPAIQYTKYLTCPAATSLVGNLAGHCRYMLASVAYLRDQIQRKPRILQLGMETASVHALSAQTQHALKQVQDLHSQLKFLKSYLDKVQDKAEFVPADLITDKNVQSIDALIAKRQRHLEQDNGKRSWMRYAVLFLVTITGGLVLFAAPSLRRPSTILLDI